MSKKEKVPYGPGIRGQRAADNAHAANPNERLLPENYTGYGSSRHGVTKEIKRRLSELLHTRKARY